MLRSFVFFLHHEHRRFFLLHVHIAFLKCDFVQLSGWFKGMATPLIGNAMVYGLMFGINELALSMESVDKDNPWHHVISGFFGGTVQCAIGSPVELAKIKLQVCHGSN